jgi:hypothetical protein
VTDFRVECSRVYNDGSRVWILCRSEDDVEEWKEYNLALRPGCALFVGSECIQRGYLSEERCAEISRELGG